MLERHELDKVCADGSFELPRLGARRCDFCRHKVRRRTASSGALVDACVFLSVLDGFEDHLVTAIEYTDPRPAPAYWVEHMPPVDGWLPTGMFRGGVDLDEFAHTDGLTLRRRRFVRQQIGRAGG